MLTNLILFQCMCRLMTEVLRRADTKRKKTLISGMITHMSDKGMWLAMMVKASSVIS